MFTHMCPHSQPTKEEASVTRLTALGGLDTLVLFDILQVMKSVARFKTLGILSGPGVTK